MKSTKILAAAVIAAFAFPVFAQTASTPRIDERQQHQQQRIDEGVRSGALNKKEQAALRKHQAKIRAMERRAMADGKMTATEKARIELAQNQESLRISKQKHNLHTAK